MKQPGRNRRRGMIIDFDYDFINSLSGEVECPYYLSEREVGALLTFMDTMGWPTRWVSDTEQAIDRDFIEGLRDGINDKLMREEDCPADPCEDGCIDYLPNSSFIRYEPNDPFRTPLLVPPGYTIIPWYTNALIAPFGVLPTDAMVNQLAVFGYAIPLSGFPRFSFEFDGRGEVELELVNVPAGGFCLIVLDENPIGFKIVNTSSNLLDVISVAGILAALGFDTEDANIVDTDIVEIDVEVAGHHRIDVTFLPNFGGETLLGFGGGLRRVTLCGPTQVIEEMYLQRQSPEDSCLIEQSTDGGITWQEAWRMDNCCCDDTPGYTRYNDDGILETSPDGETWTENRDIDPRFTGTLMPPLTSAVGEGRRCEAANRVVGYYEAVANDAIADSSAWSGLTFLLAALIPLLILLTGATAGAATPLLLGVVGALLATGSAAFDAAMTAGVYQTLLCIVYCETPSDGVYTEENWQRIKTQIKAQLTGIASTFLHDTINAGGPVGLNNASRVGISAGLECDECDCAADWCYEWIETEQSPDWFMATSQPFGSYGYLYTEGWGTSQIDGVSGTRGDGYSAMIIQNNMPSSNVTSVEVWVTGGAPTLRRVGFPNAYSGFVNMSFVVDHWVVTGSWTVTQMRIFFECFSVGNPCKLTKIRLSGLGVNPFGEDNCV